MSRALCVAVLRLLREERERLGITKYALAQKSGVSPQMISYVDRGLRNPTLETVLLMSEAMQVDLAEIITKARKGLNKSKIKSE